MSRPEPRRDFSVVDAVIVPRRSRLRTGFHRLGMVLAAPLVLGALFIFSVALFGKPASPAETYGWGVASLVGAGVVYGLCRMLAWVIAGFFGD